MNKKLKRLWCASLRGGTWTQIRHQYHDQDRGRCALGVLQGITNRMPEMDVSDHTWNEIVKMNDTDGLSLSEIADWIEKNL